MNREFKKIDTLNFILLHYELINRVTRHLNNQQYICLKLIRIDAKGKITASSRK